MTPEEFAAAPSYFAEMPRIKFRRWTHVDTGKGMIGVGFRWKDKLYRLVSEIDPTWSFDRIDNLEYRMRRAAMKTWLYLRLGFDTGRPETLRLSDQQYASFAATSRDWQAANPPPAESRGIEVNASEVIPLTPRDDA